MFSRQFTSWGLFRCFTGCWSEIRILLVLVWIAIHHRNIPPCLPGLCRGSLWRFFSFGKWNCSLFPFHLTSYVIKLCLHVSRDRPVVLKFCIGRTPSLSKSNFQTSKKQKVFWGLFIDDLVGQKFKASWWSTSCKFLMPCFLLSNVPSSTYPGHFHFSGITVYILRTVSILYPHEESTLDDPLQAHGIKSV